MNWGRRLREWYEVLRLEGERGRLPWWKMVRAVWSGPVPRAVWRRRMRTCLRCPLYNPAYRSCRPVSHPHLGCGCYVPFTALSAAPYDAGCWGRGMAEDVGWPSYQDPRRFARLRLVLAFLRAK